MPSEPPAPPTPDQPGTDLEFWQMVAKMGFALPKDEIQQQIVEASQRVGTAWSAGRAGSADANIATKFADNQKYFIDPPATAQEYAQRSLDFAKRQDANTSYYLDLRYSLKGGSRVSLLKFDQVTYEVLSVNSKNQVTWYSQWRGMLKLPGYLYVPPGVYKKASG